MFANSAAVIPSNAGNNRLDNLAITGTLAPTSAVPESASLGMLGMGIVDAIGYGRRRKLA